MIVMVMVSNADRFSERLWITTRSGILAEPIREKSLMQTSGD
jgi:hypothetical protein